MKKKSLLLSLFLAVFLIGVSNYSRATISGTNHVCQGSTVTLVDSGAGGTSYWLSGDTSVASIGITSGVVTGLRPGSSLISHRSSSGTDTFRIFVYSLPRPITGTFSVCTGATTALRDSSGLGTWTSSSTTIATVTADGTVHGVNTGTVTITYTDSAVRGGCSVTASVAVSAAPSTAGAITGSTTVCTGSSVTFADSISGGVWSVSRTSLATITTGGVATGLAAGVDTVKYTVSNSCGSVVARKVLTVSATPTVASISGSSTVCVGSSITLTDSTSGGTWSSSSTTIATVRSGSSGATVYGASTGYTTISYTVTSGSCSAVATHTVTVGTGSSSAGTISGPSSVCRGTTITLVDSTVSGGAWSSSATGVASVNSYGVVTGVSAGSATITYTVTSSCGTYYATHTVAVTTGSTSAGSISGATSVCTGSTITLVDTTVTGGTWSSSATGVASVNPGGVVTGVSTGTATISYSVTSTCGTFVATHAVSVIATPTTSISGPSTVCVGSIITLVDSTASGGVS